jgi:subtilisin family serine protease
VQGALVVIAAGNAGTDNDDFPPVPACYPDGRQKGVITVMATNRCGEKASFSNYGRKTVDLSRARRGHCDDAGGARERGRR